MGPHHSSDVSAGSAAATGAGIIGGLLLGLAGYALLGPHCPNCNALIGPIEVIMRARTFKCSNCGVELEWK